MASAPAEAEFRRMFELAGVGMARVDPDTQRFLRVNPKLAQITGYSEDELLERSVLELTHPHDREACQAEWEKTLRGESPQFAVEKRYVRKDGRVIWVRVVATLLRDEGGKPLSTVSSIEEISQSKRAEEAARETESKLQAFIRATSDVVYEMSADWREMRFLAGKGFITTTEHPRPDWTEAYIPEEEKARVWAAIRQAIETKSNFELEHRVIRLDGSVGWTFSRAIPLLDERGEIVQWFGAASDITERRQAEQSRAWLAAIVESSTDAITSFDPGGRILTWNPAAERMFGYTAAEVVGRPLGLFVPPGLEAEQAEILEQVGQGEHVVQRETRRLRKNGRPLEVSLTISPIKNERGEVIAGTAIIQDITQRKRAEAALRESEERYRDLVEQVQDYAIFSTDPQGVITTWNEGCRKVLGYDPAEFIGMHFGQLFPPESREAGLPEQELEAAARLGACSDDRWMLRKDGERFWATGTTNAVRDPSGKLSGFTKVMRDLTPQMQAEAALRQSQERLALTLEAGGLGIWDSDLVNRRTYWSPEQERLFGLEPGRFDGHFSERLHPQDRGRVLRKLVELRSSGGDYQDEYRVVWPNGTVRWLAARGRVYRDPAGRAVRILGVNFDITERRQAEAALQESEERFRVMADSSPLMIWTTDPQGRVEFVNRAYQEFFGVSAEEIRQWGWQPLIHPEDQAAYTRPFLECLRERRGFWGQARVRHKSGEWRWVASYAAPRFSATGEFLGMVGSSPDISEIKAVEAQLKELVEAQRRFVADASHELRAPLASVLGNLELLRRYPDMPQQDRHLALQDAHNEASRMSRLVHDLLALARGDEGMRLRHEPLRLDTLLTAALRQARLLDGGHRLERSLEPLTVRGDPDRLKELFLILLDNALKYTPPGGTIRLELSAQDPPGEPPYAEVRVSDSGVGIAPEDLPYVFERFYRADKARTRPYPPADPGGTGGDPGGTGLGLSIAKQIVEAHGGQIRLESRPGQGTTVIVRLPSR